MIPPTVADQDSRVNRLPIAVLDDMVHEIAKELFAADDAEPGVGRRMLAAARDEESARDGQGDYYRQRQEHVRAHRGALFSCLQTNRCTTYPLLLA